MSIDQDTTEAFAVLARRVRRLETQVAYALSGGPCVTFVCGATGWRGTGGVIPRTLVHEVAFQLDTGGNPRGAYAVDLQQDRNLATEVAAGDYSFVVGYRNRVDGDYSSAIGRDHEVYADNSFAWGYANTIHADNFSCFNMGLANQLLASPRVGSYSVFTFGEGIDIEETNYGFFSGAGHDVLEEAFGVTTFGEQNLFKAWWDGVHWDHPTYSASIGLFQRQYGDIWLNLQTGEQNFMGGEAVTGHSNLCMWNFASGFRTYLRNARECLAFGEEVLSHNFGNSTDWFDGRLVWGDGVNAYVPYPGSFPEDGGYQGFNQSSGFSKSEAISTWNVAWTTSWEFPIIQDSIWYFKAVIVGTESGCANSYCWILEGLIENDGGNTTMLNVTATVNYYRDVVTKEWQAIADNVNDRLAFQFRDTAGPDATFCNIQMQTFTVEVGST